MAQYEAANHLSDLMATVRKTFERAELRSIAHHEYTITQYPDMFYDVTGLEKGQHPYHATGDWDCDGEDDQAVILQEPKAQIVVVLSSGMTLAHETSVDAISPGERGRFLTAKCGFIHAEYWGKSSIALVVDLNEGKLIEHRTSD